MTTEKILGKTYRVGTKGHARAVAQKKHFDELEESETKMSDTDWDELKKDEMQWEARQEMEDNRMSLEEQFASIFSPYILWK